MVQSSLKLGEAIYKQNPQGEAPQADPSGKEPSSEKKDDKTDDKVVDAEFEEVDELPDTIRGERGFGSTGR